MLNMRDWKTTRFTKTIRLTPEHSNYVNEIKGKKSRAGKLEEIIEEHRKRNKKKTKEIAKVEHSNHVEHSDYVEKKSIINDVMKVLYEINPMLNFANKTERSAVQRLIDRLGEEKTLASAKAAKAVHGKKFAPSITTPLELERNLSKLVAFYKQNSNESKVISI